MSGRASPLARLLLAVYALLIIYASLYPLSAWHEPAGSAFAFLTAAWPRYVTRFDIAVNVLGYLPLGLLGMLALHPALRGLGALLFVTTGCALLSLGLEATQSYVPPRHPSALDLAANAGGALIGAWLAHALGPWLLEAGPLRRLRARFIAEGTAADVGMVVLGLWLFSQLNPATLLFGTGDLRDLFVPPEGPAYAPALFIGVEAVTVACNVVAVALLLSVIAASGRSLRTMALVVILAALAVRTVAYSVVMQAGSVFAWLTPGAIQGLVVGLAVALVALGLPRRLRILLAALLVMGAAILVNLAPANPYLAATLALWRQGHFLNFNGLTRLVSALWPFSAIAYLSYFATQRADR
jgi:VanZ family protein